MTVTQTSTYSITCSGAGGQTSASATVTAWAAPTATVTSSDAEILADNTTTITWSSQNAKTCKGTAGLAEGISTSGTLTTPSLTATTTYSLECVNPVYPAAAASVQVAVSKTYELLVTARYERPGKGKAGADGIVIPDWDNPIVATIPNVWIELQKATGETVAGAFASNDGAVRFTGLDPAQKYIPTLRSKAKNGSGFELWVVNNTKPISTVATTIRTRYEPYKDAAAEFAADKKKVKQELIVTAGLGWDKASQKLTDTQRVSGPYAIVADAMTQQSFLLPTGARNAINAIDILWSVGNKGGGTSPQADFDKGIVEGFSAFYSPCGATISTDGIRTGCGATDKTPFIWLFGSQTQALREFSTYTVSHEMTHFTQDQSQRNYTTAGSHGPGEWQDITLAQHEGLANGVPVMITKSPVLERIQFSQGRLVSSILDFSKPDTAQGWFQENTIAQLVWRLIDPAGAFKLTGVQLLAPFYSDTWKSGAFAPNIWAYGSILKNLQPSLSPAIDSLGSELKISFAGNDVWGSQETILGNRTSSQTFPIFTRVPTNGSVQVCSVGAKAEYNKLSNRRYLRFDGDGTTARTYTVSGTTGTVPYIYVAKAPTGSLVAGRVRGSKSLSTGSITIPAGGTWGWVGECSVVGDDTESVVDGFCGNSTYTAPTETCWTITAVQ